MIHAVYSAVLPGTGKWNLSINKVVSKCWNLKIISFFLTHVTYWISQNWNDPSTKTNERRSVFRRFEWDWLYCHVDQNLIRLCPCVYATSISAHISCTIVRDGIATNIFIGWWFLNGKRVRLLDTRNWIDEISKLNIWESAARIPGLEKIFQLSSHYPHDCRSVYCRPILGGE